MRRSEVLFGIWLSFTILGFENCLQLNIDAFENAVIEQLAAVDLGEGTRRIPHKSGDHQRGAISFSEFLGDAFND